MKLYQGGWLAAWVIKWTLILQGMSPTEFGRAKNVWIQRDFWQLSNLIANISGTDRHIENRESNLSATFHPLLNKFGELWSTNQNVMDAHVDLLNWTFSKYKISALRLCWTLKLLHTADIGQGSLAHCTNRVGIPQNFQGEHFKLGLKFYTWAPITMGQWA